MSRARRFIRNVTSGYLLLFASMLYVLASVPLALKFLTKEEFGLWALMTQITGYLALIDLGTSSSVSRLLIDCKDRPDDGDYGSLIQTGGLVLICQGVIILFVGILASPLASHLLQIPSHLETSFVYLMRWQSVILAAGFVTRVFGHVLYAHQRNDHVNYVQAILSVANLFVLWVAFLAGVGTYSILWVSATSCVVTSITYVGFCVKLRLLPKKGRWGVPSWERFRELFQYGKDVFLISLGRQLTMASQTLVISRSLGLGAVAAWSVGTRIFNLLLQLISRIFDFAQPIFAEMVVRGERDNLRERFRSTTTLGASLSGVAAVLFALCNTPFVSLWTSGKIIWSVQFDVLLGIWLIVLVQVGCHMGLVLASKRIEWMRYVYFAEGAIFVVLATLAGPRGGLSAIVVVSILCSLGFSYLQGLRHTVSFLGFSMWEIAVDWLTPMTRIILFLAPVALLAGWAFRPLTTFPKLLAAGLPVGAYASYLLLRYGIPNSLKGDVAKHAPKVLSRWLGRVIGVP
jgi:O-antigen/teichoic acid export membrane protein